MRLPLLAATLVLTNVTTYSQENSNQDEIYIYDADQARAAWMMTQPGVLYQDSAMISYGIEYFKRMTDEVADSVDSLLKDQIGWFEREIQNPDNHKECDHGSKRCWIERAIDGYKKTREYMVDIRQSNEDK